MAKTSVVKSDLSGAIVPEADVVQIRVIRKESVQTLDASEKEARDLFGDKGATAAKAGRKPAEAKPAAPAAA